MDKNAERAEQWTAPKHDHIDSVYVRCKDCLMFGVPMPGEYQCGNCNSHNTVSYVPPCCVKQALDEAEEMACRTQYAADMKERASEWLKAKKEGLEIAKGIAEAMDICPNRTRCGKEVADEIRAKARELK